MQEKEAFYYMIGLFNDCFPPIMDGVSVTTRNYAYWLNRKRGDICVVTPQTPQATDDEGYLVYRYLSIPIPMRKPYRLGFPRIDWPFHRQISRIPFELVHAHCPFSSGYLARQIAQNQHIPMIATFHSKYRDDFRRIIHNHYMIDYLIRNIVDFYEQADEVWIPQAAVEETLREYGYQGRVEVVDNGNDFSGSPYSMKLKQKTCIELGLDPDAPVLLFVGQHIWEKNIRFILESLAKLKHYAFQMLFIGTGYAAEDIKHLAEQLHLTEDCPKTGLPYISFLGKICDRECLKQYYTAADVFLFPSLYDNAPLVVREAAAMHTPSLLIENSTAAEIITDNVNGFLCPDDTDSYAVRLATLLTDRKAIERVGQEASRTLARSWKDIAEEVNDRYNHLILRRQLRTSYSCCG